VDLRVADLEGDVAEPLRLAEGAGSLDHLRRDVDPQRAPDRSHTGRVPRRLTGPTTDIEYAVLGADGVPVTEDPVVQPQLSVVIDEPIRELTHDVSDATGWSATIPSESCTSPSRAVTSADTWLQGFVRQQVIVKMLGADDLSMERLLVECETEAGEIWVLRVRRRWMVRVGGEDFETQGGKEDATARAFSIAQLGDEAQDVVIFGRNGEIEERRTFRPRI
jgi:hypothetical protein